jgi:hypothetical protein
MIRAPEILLIRLGASGNARVMDRLGASLLASFTKRMAYQMALDLERRLATVYLTGAVNGDELTEATATLLDDAGPGWLDMVWEGSDITALHLMPGDLERVLEVKVNRSDSAAEPRLDVLVVRRPLDVMIARLFVLLARRHGLHAYVCRTKEDARKFLGVPDLPEPEPVVA